MLWEALICNHLKGKRTFTLTSSNFFISTLVFKFAMIIFLIHNCYMHMFQLWHFMISQFKSTSLTHKHIFHSFQEYIKVSSGGIAWRTICTHNKSHLRNMLWGRQVCWSSNIGRAMDMPNSNVNELYIRHIKQVRMFTCGPTFPRGWTLHWVPNVHGLLWN